MTDELTRMENESIRAFVKQAASEGYLSGRVLDYGCGKQPYRSLVEATGGEYHGFDRSTYPASQVKNVGHEKLLYRRDWDAVLNTQVVQYLPYALHDWYLKMIWSCLKEQHGHLVLTYPTNWPEVQEEDLHRFTKAGMERLLTEAGFTIVMHQRRESIHLYGYDWAFGYGVVARA